MRRFRFYKKEHNGKNRWWIDIRPWILPKRFLIMYPSAEEWLEIVGGGRGETLISVSTKEFAGAEVLYRDQFEGLIRGTSYMAKTYKGSPAEHKVLLYPVTLYVFGRYPKEIYYRVSPEASP